MIEKIPYLEDLGVTALELLPVQEFDELRDPRVNPRTGERLQNYWGYNTSPSSPRRGATPASGAPGRR